MTLIRVNTRGAASLTSTLATKCWHKMKPATLRNLRLKHSPKTKKKRYLFAKVKLKRSGMTESRGGTENVLKAIVKSAVTDVGAELIASTRTGAASAKKKFYLPQQRINLTKENPLGRSSPGTNPSK